MYRQYQLAERKESRFVAPLITEQPLDIIVPNSLRSCTDVICAILMFIFIGGFVGLLVYGAVKGSASSVIAVHNSDGVRCSTDPTYKYGYLPDKSFLGKAVCVAECPSTVNVAMSCLTDSVNCQGGTFTPTYAAFPLDSYCIPSDLGTNINLESIFNLNAFENWLYDLQEGWIVLACAAGAGVILSLLFFVFVRCCAGPIIWLAIFICNAGLITIGVFFILQAKGVTVPDFVHNQLSTLSYDTLIIVGSCLIGGAVLLSILAICLKSRISMGIRAVQLGSIFLLENCCLVILPLSQALLIIGAFAALIYGAASLYSLGSFSFPDDSAFPIVYLQVGQIVMVSLYLAASLWVIFFFHGCNHFMLCSAVSIWYFNNLNNTQGAPCGDSIWRLIRYHPGSVAFASLINGLFFSIKILANLLSFEAKDDDSALVSCCLKCLNALFCIFKCFLRFLNDGTYVQIAISAQNYCSSTLRAFDLLADNVLKVGVTDSISVFFTFLGVLGISVGVAAGAYFSVLYIPFYQERIESPLVLTVVSGIIAFVISTIYLSMIDTSASSILQCYLVDHESGNGKIRYANDRVREIMTID